MSQDEQEKAAVTPEQRAAVDAKIAEIGALLEEKLSGYIGDPVTPEMQEKIEAQVIENLRQLGGTDITITESTPEKIGLSVKLPAEMFPTAWRPAELCLPSFSEALAAAEHLFDASGAYRWMLDAFTATAKAIEALPAKYRAAAAEQVAMVIWDEADWIDAWTERSKTFPNARYVPRKLVRPIWAWQEAPGEWSIADGYSRWVVEGLPWPDKDNPAPRRLDNAALLSLILAAARAGYAVHVERHADTPPWPEEGR
jgi:hypothetical protein